MCGTKIGRWSAAASARKVAAWMVAACVALVAWTPGTARAQYAPDGNAHPETVDLSASGGEGDASRVNPFGDGAGDAPVPTVAEKVAFAEAVDLAPLRGLAVFHNGRVKILDTLGREMVSKVTDLKGYQSFVHTPKEGGGESIRAVRHDPLFVMLDMIIDPRFYFDKPLIGVNYLPLREEILEREFADRSDAERKELVSRWKKLGRVTPRMTERHIRPIYDAHMSETAWVESIGKVDSAMLLFINLRQNLLVVSPDGLDEPWLHLSQKPETSAARVAATDLGRAWRARDAKAANEAIVRLAAELPKVNPSTYPQGRRELELLYNRSNAFVWGYWLYAVSLVTLLLAFGTGRRTLVTLGTATLIVAVGLHAAGFALRCIIAERFAIQNQFESMTGVSLFGAGIGLVLMRVRRQALFGAASAALGFMVLLAANEARIPGQHIEREAAILNTSVLLKYHVSIVLLSYGLITLAFIIALFYLGTAYMAKVRDGGGGGSGGAGGGSSGGGGVVMARLAGAGGASDPMLSVALNVDAPVTSVAAARSRLLADLDKAHLIVLQLAFWTLGVGILLGAWWADHSWGRWWAFDPKEIWALITWIVYLAIIHLRFVPMKDRGLTTAWLSVLGFVAMLWCYFGVNLLLPGLHAYA
jgi:cytochrome c-type biogenesis protein CcsB